ncbi:MAG: pantetheine-phosphate adenylyltransferase [Candidatus Omnitrophica bacterium]|nr:pantetheine-phosphate adenylyltransferase [Candidatus Omnitrophota bacterium]
MKRAICPGTFDPITNGHIDIIKRAAFIFDKVTVAVVQSPSKDTLFSYSERVALVKEVTKDIKGIEVEGFDGLVVDFARKRKASVIVRGLRMISDFEYEFQMALTNRNLAPGIETMFLMPHPQYSYISSRLIKEAAFLGADLKQFLPGTVLKALRKKIDESSPRANK